MSILSKAYFHDEAAAFAKLEEIIWPNGPVCPKCGHDGKIYTLKGVRSKPSKKNPEGIERHGLKKCGKCRKQFTARVGTVFESSHIPLHKWFQAVHLLCSSKKGISSHQIHRILEITYKSAWFMTHRIREAMRSGDLTPMGGVGGIVEVDETFIGHDKTKKPKGEKKGRGYHHKYKVLTLVDRETGQARSIVLDDLKASTIAPIVRENLANEGRLMTDEASYYKQVGKEFADHQIVRHNQGEYGRGEYHTNTIEGFFSIFKRGMKGTYQHCSEKHLHRYVAEFDFRYNYRVQLGVDDQTRCENVIRGITGRRLTYEGS
ncbi:MAG: IS1595 family transposase [Pseudomonadota bacterium]